MQICIIKRDCLHHHSEQINDCTIKKLLPYQLFFAAVKHRQLTVAVTVTLVLGLVITLTARSQQSPPFLAHKGTAKQLMVNGKPFLVLGGELGNSSASDLTYMQPEWKKFTAMNLNTILIPVYWELIEPQEGKFNFTLVDSLIATSQKNNLKVRRPEYSHFT